MLVTASSGDGLERRMPEYEKELCRVGIPLRWFVHSGGGHIARAQDIMRERTELMVEMVFGK